MWLTLILGAFGHPHVAAAQTAPVPGSPSAAASAAPLPTDSSRPWEIEDNSFFVEEAFNQDAGVVQTIYGGAFNSSGWLMTFTQEWPAPGLKHQLSYAIPVTDINEPPGTPDVDGVGDIALNYRYQLLEEGPGRPAISPRLTVLCPTGDAGRGLGVGAWGWQTNLPVSKQVRDFYFHGNAGLTWYPRVRTDSGTAGVSAPDVALTSPFLAASTIYRLRPMLNVMLESVVTWQAAVDGPGHASHNTLTLVSPGMRTGWNRGETQIVVGVAAPITWAAGRSNVGVFAYFSYEARFWGVKESK